MAPGRRTARGAARRSRCCATGSPTVLGASAALGEHLARHPADWRLLTGDVPVAPGPVSELRAELLAAVGADPVTRAGSRAPAGGDPATRLRVGYRRRLLRLAAGDLTGEVPLDEVMAGLADLTVAALDAALAIARADCARALCRCRGGAGPARGHRDGQVRRARAELRQRRRPDLRGRDRTRRRCAARRALASGLIRVCSQSTPEGALFPVDANLRPGGPGRARWCGPWPATWPTTSAGRRPGSSRRCSRPGSRSATPSWRPSTWPPSPRWSGRPRSARTSSPTCRRCAGGSSRRLPADQAGRELKLGPRRPARHRVRGAAAPARARPRG